MLNESTRKRLLSICQKVAGKKAVSDFDLVWAQKLAIHDEECASLLKKGGKYIPPQEQEDTTEV
jgi:hypothetical protein